MGYIGRTPAYGNFEKDNHTGDGVTSQFNLTYPVASPTQLLVSLDGVIQEPDYSYNVTMVSGQGKINFSEAPDIGARIFIVYVGRQLLTAGSNAPSTYLDEFNGDDSTVSFTLTRTPATTDAANFIVYVDNIYQREGSSYAFTISGETITFTSAPPTGTNNIQVYQLALSNEVNTVSDGTVTEAKLANGAVTENKIADNAVTENKITNNAVTENKIADNAVTPSKLGTGANIITQADMWRLNQNHSTNNAVITVLERDDSASAGIIGAGVTQSSGVFSFPETGLYMITAHIYFTIVNVPDNCTVKLQAKMTSGGSFSDIALCSETASSPGDCGSGFQAFVKVDDISQVSVRFYAESLNSSNYVYGQTGRNASSFSFIRLGDAS